MRLSIDYGFESEYAGMLYEAISGLAAVAAANGQERTTATLSGGADAATGERHDAAIARRLEQRFFAPARAHVGEPAWQEAYAAGARLDLDQVIETALRSLELRAVA